MTAYFDRYAQDDVDAAGFVGIAAMSCQHTVPEPADDSAFNHVLSLIQDQQIERVEFVHRPGGPAGPKEYRGAILYRNVASSRPEPFVHVLHALLGYDGSGPGFSRAIMGHLGMQDTVFDRMNDSVRGIRSSNHSYVVLALNLGGEWTYDPERSHE